MNWFDDDAIVPLELEPSKIQEVVGLGGC